MKKVHKNNSMITYFIDEESKCITAVIPVTELTQDVHHTIQKSLNKNNTGGNIYIHKAYIANDLVRTRCNSSYIKATVRLSQGDKYDESEGMQIACKKVLVKYYNFKRKILLDFSQQYLTQWMKDIYLETEYATNRYVNFLAEYDKA